MKTNIKLIQYLNDNNLLRAYAVWLNLKHVHINSKYYDCSLLKLSKHSGISRNGLRKYVDHFKQLNWIREEGKNLVFISHTKLKALCGVKLTWDIRVSAGKVNELINNLRFEILKNKQRQFNFIKEKLVNRSNPTGKNALQKYKAAVKACLKFGVNTAGEVPKNLKISLIKLSSILNISPAGVSRLISKFVLAGKCQRISNKKTIGYHNTWLSHLPENHYQYRGFIVSVECNQYIF